MTDLPTPPAGFKLVNPVAEGPEVPQGWALADDRPEPPEGFVYEDHSASTKAYQGQILPFRVDEKGEKHWSVPGIIQGAWDAVELPYDVATGKADINSPEGFDRAMNMAGLLVGGRTPGLSRTVLVDEAGQTVPRAVTKALQRDNIPFAEIGSRVREIGPDALVADTGPNVRDLAAAIATKPGAGQRTVVDTLTARRDAAPARLTSAIDETFGPAPIPSRIHAEIRTNQRVLGPLYDQALAHADPVDTSFIAGGLDRTIPELRGPAQNALQNVRAMLNETGTANLDNRPNTLFQVRRAVDGMLDNENDGNVRRVLGDVRRQIDDELARAVPGIKEIDASYSELRGQHDAVDRGQTVLGNGRNDPRPLELAEETAAGALPSGFLIGPSGVTHRLRDGARAEIDRIVGTNLNDRAALASMMKGNSDWNFDRLVTLFGPGRTNRLYRILEQERTMAGTENAALAGSKTASVQAAQREFEGANGHPSPVTSLMDLKPGTAAASAFDTFLGGMRERLASNRSARAADALMSAGNLQPFLDPILPVRLIAGALLNARRDANEP